jgi:hypothetical protein
MTDHPSGNPRWEPTSGSGVPAVPPPERLDGPAADLEPGAVALTQPTRSVASWLGWSPTRWRSETES